MIKKVRKIFFIWDFEKEEKWLNEMASKGLNLIKPKFLTYYFEQGTPDEYTYRLEMLDNWPDNPESQDYIRFVEETGAEYLGSMFRWVYFRKRKSRGQFNLFSDIDSRLKHLKGLLYLIVLIGLLNSVNLVNVIHNILPIDRTTSLLALSLVGLVELLMLYGLIRVLILRGKLKKERNLRE